jgi:hypothetical protein
MKLKTKCAPRGTNKEVNKMQAKQTGVIWTVIIAAAILLVLGGFAYVNVMNSMPSAEDVASKVVVPTQPTPKVPTADEIAAKINVPEYDDSKILEKLYPVKANQLRNKCIDDLQDEFNQNDAIKRLRKLIETKEGESIVDLQVTDWNYKNDYKFKIINLGLDDVEDREGSLTTTLRVTYELEDGNGETIRTKAYLYAYCGDFDKSENEFQDLRFKVNL